MPAETIEAAYQAQIAEVVGTLFRTMLETEIAPADVPQASGEMVTALVSFGGNWKGAFELECESTSALNFARRFLQCDDIAEFNEEVRDAVGELANVVAGNLKQILPLGTTLGAPSIVEGKDYKVRVCREHVIGSTGFSTDVGFLTVRLIGESKANGEMA